MKSIKHDKGQAGLEILLAIITMIFAIGMLVMIFVIMSGKMMDTDALYYRSSVIGVNVETLTSVDGAGENFSVSNYRGVQCNIIGMQNASNDKPIIAGNWTQYNCKVTNNTLTTATLSGSNWEVNYTYTYLYDKSGVVEKINDTSKSIAGVVDWFDIILIISAMVVLILLTVIIISAIKGTGGVGGNQGNMNSGKVGTA